MPPRRPSPPPPPEIKQFTPDEIEHGITKLRRRIEEVKALDPHQPTGLAQLTTPAVRYDDQRVRNAEHAISTTILEVFGPNSPEYRRHQHHRIWHGGRWRPVKWWKLTSALFRFVDVVEVAHSRRSRMSPWLGWVPPTRGAWL